MAIRVPIFCFGQAREVGDEVIDVLVLLGSPTLRFGPPNTATITTKL